MRYRQNRLALMACAIGYMGLSGCGGSGQSGVGGTTRVATKAVSQVDAGKPAFVPNQLLVKFATPSSTFQQAALNRVGGKALEHIMTNAMKASGDTSGVMLMETRDSVELAIEKLRGQPGIVYAEPNYIYQHQAVSNDPYYTNGSLWGMYGSATTPSNQYGSQAASAWAANHTGNANVYVGIIDEGVMFNHTDLNGQVWTNPFDPVDGIDNDGNGYIDDTHGWDFASNDNSIFDGSADDHGTHVAGTIGAKGGNGTGVAGVCWNVTIISAKFLGRNGGTTANAIKAFDYVTDLKIRHGLDIVATNNSWGGGGFSQALQDAITRHGNANILAIIAAGNGGSDGIGDNNDSVASYPSNYPNSNIIAVASITSTGGLSSFSNYGATTVDIGAPGSAINSTLPTKSGSSTYGSYSGTSMATPHVTGAVALLAASSASRGLTLKSALLAAATPTASLNGKCTSNGRLNASGF